jgi:hypothetical protein
LYETGTHTQLFSMSLHTNLTQQYLWMYLRTLADKYKVWLIWGQCYDHNFLLVLPLFGGKKYDFIKKQCCACCFTALSAPFWVKNANNFVTFCCYNIFLKSYHWPHLNIPMRKDQINCNGCPPLKKCRTSASILVLQMYQNWKRLHKMFFLMRLKIFFLERLFLKAFQDFFGRIFNFIEKLHFRQNIFWQAVSFLRFPPRQILLFGQKIFFWTCEPQI